MNNVVVLLGVTPTKEWVDYCQKHELEFYNLPSDVSKLYVFDLLFQSDVTNVDKILLVTKDCLPPNNNLFKKDKGTIYGYHIDEQKENKYLSEYFYNFQLDDKLYLDDKILLIDSSHKRLLDSIKIMYKEFHEDLVKLHQSGINVERGLINYFIHIFNIQFEIL